MELFWNDLVSKHRSGTLSKDETLFFKKLTKALKNLSQNPRHNSLNSHDIDPLSRRYGVKVWESYLAAAGRIEPVIFSGFMDRISSR